MGVSPTESVRALLLDTSDRKPAHTINRTSSCGGPGLHRDQASRLRGAWQGQGGLGADSNWEEEGSEVTQVLLSPGLSPSRGTESRPEGAFLDPSLQKDPGAQACRGRAGVRAWLREAHGGHWLSSRVRRHGPGCRGGRAGRASPWPLNTDLTSVPVDRAVPLWDHVA